MADNTNDAPSYVRNGSFCPYCGASLTGGSVYGHLRENKSVTERFTVAVTVGVIALVLTIANLGFMMAVLQFMSSIQAAM
ncbi:MAG: hypothetical protein IJH83_02715 [Coriobacteriales bacterium]|nr:hypothetical protein [Coriobacteriales bacterium]